MKANLVERTLRSAEYVVEHHATLRDAARRYGLGKSTVHTDLTKRLPRIDAALAREVHVILQYNHETRHIRGGESTRKKYADLRAQKCKGNQPLS